MKKSTRKLTIAKETLQRLEAQKVGGATFDPVTIYASARPWEWSDCPEVAG